MDNIFVSKYKLTVELLVIITKLKYHYCNNLRYYNNDKHAPGKIEII